MTTDPLRGLTEEEIARARAIRNMPAMVDEADYLRHLIEREVVDQVDQLLDHMNAQRPTSQAVPGRLAMEIASKILNALRIEGIQVVRLHAVSRAAD